MWMKRKPVNLSIDKLLSYSVRYLYSRPQDDQMARQTIDNCKVLSHPLPHRLQVSGPMYDSIGIRRFATPQSESGRQSGHNPEWLRHKHQPPRCRTDLCHRIHEARSSIVRCGVIPRRTGPSATCLAINGWVRTSCASSSAGSMPKT